MLEEPEDVLGDAETAEVPEVPAEFMETPEYPDELEARPEPESQFPPVFV